MIEPGTKIRIAFEVEDIYTVTQPITMHELETLKEVLSDNCGPDFDDVEGYVNDVFEKGQVVRVPIATGYGSCTVETCD